MTNFLSLGISETTVNILKTQGIANPTPIQEQAIPIVLEGKDVIAQSQTGTGKTFAFILPILEKVDTTKSHIQALIVTPTRELALQITNEINKLIVNRPDVRVLAIYGGQDVEQQLKKLKNGRHIVIGTPGRLLDHIRRETVDFSNTKFLVLDEADQMLHIGFLPEVEQIISETSKDRQTMLFSATMPDEIKKLARRHMKTPHNIQVEKTQAPLENIKQIAISTVDRAKQSDLIDLLHLYRPFLGVIFCRTKRRVTKLYEALKDQGFNCDELHGDLSQAKREQVMKRFRKAEIQFLIATDVAARGLDVEGVTHVFNYDIPEDTESYIHRIGRTGRAGGQGLAVTLYAPKDREDLLKIETDLNLTIPKKNIGNEKKNLGVETSGEENRTVAGEKSQKRAKKGKNEREAVRRSKLKESRLSQSSSKDRENRGAKPDNNNFKGKDRNEGFQVTKGPRDTRGIKRGDDRNQEAAREPRGVKRNNRTGDFKGSAQGRNFSEGQRNHRTGTGQPSAEGKRDSRSPVRGKTSIRGEHNGERTNRTSDRKPFGDRKPQGQHTRTNKRGSGPRSR